MTLAQNFGGATACNYYNRALLDHASPSSSVSPTFMSAIATTAYGTEACGPVVDEMKAATATCERCAAREAAARRTTYLRAGRARTIAAPPKVANSAGVGILLKTANGCSSIVTAAGARASGRSAVGAVPTK